MATDYDNLVPNDVAARVINGMIEGSAVMRLANVVRMPAGLQTFPVASVLPTAHFRARYGGRRELSNIEWNDAQLTPYPLTVSVMIPNDAVSDLSFDVWADVEPKLASALGKAFDAATIAGTGAPAAFPSPLITLASTAILGSSYSGDMLKAFSAAMALIEASGLEPTGAIVARTAGQLLRDVRVEGALVAPGAMGQIYGVDLARSGHLAASDADFLIGDFSKYVVGVRQDITYELSRDAVFTDGAGNVVVSARETGQTALICEMRVGAAAPLPIDSATGSAIVPFARVKDAA